MIAGNIFDIQRFCTHDGPGIRTTVFFKGCANKCPWCHNPESLDSKARLRFTKSQCINCGACIAICPNEAVGFENGTITIDRCACVSCGLCADICPAKALELVGRRESVDVIVETAKRDKAFYDQSGGGVTISGGEPLEQASFLSELLTALKAEGINTAIETAGNVPLEDFELVLPLLDILIIDYKLADAKKLIDITGINIERLDAIIKSAQSKVPIIVRTPVIDGINNDEQSIIQLSEKISGIDGLMYWELLPYHGLASAKYDGFGMDGHVAYKTLNEADLVLLAKTASKKVGEVRLSGETYQNNFKV